MFGGGGTSPSMPCAAGVGGLDESAAQGIDGLVPPPPNIHPLAVPLAFVDLVIQRRETDGRNADLDATVNAVWLHGHDGVLRVGRRCQRLDLLPHVPGTEPGILRVGGLEAR